MPEPAGPRDAVAAVVHPSPYPYYARLRRGQPLFFDEGLGLWVTSSYRIVEQALSHPGLRVRPPAEPVPRALAGMPAGEVFARLVRMTDGDFHAAHKPAVQQAASRFALADVARVAADCATGLARRVDANAWLSAVPVRSMARLLGVADAQLDATFRWVEAFVQGIAANAGAQAQADASEAALHLMAQGEALGLDAVRAANRVALMQQSLDATAGLLGNTALLLRERPRLVGPGASADAWRNVVAEVARWDSPVQNTRRFATDDLVLAGQPVARGQGVLLVLASANRDAALNPDPDRFDEDRPLRRCMSFGAGRHACPGEAIAIEIAAAGLRALHGSEHGLQLFGRSTGFQPLANTRIPVFET